MQIRVGVPDIKVNNEFIIETVQTFKEDEQKVILKCAEYVPQFIRGFVCDMECKYIVKDHPAQTNEGVDIQNLKDLVLVYIHKDCDHEYIPCFDYVFYK